MHAFTPVLQYPRLVLVRSPRLTRPCLSSGLALHLSRRETAGVVGGLSCIALGVALLAAETELVVLLLALVTTGFALAAVRLGVVSLEADIEEVLLIGLGDICALAF